MDYQSIHDAALAVIMSRSPGTKSRLGQEIARAWRDSSVNLEVVDDVPPNANRIEDPGRPELPQLVHPRELCRRSLYTEAGRITFMHAIAHIEFNAINLAWDAVYRFRGQPRDFYDDWIEVATDEARHFMLVQGYLVDRGGTYGDYPAHNGLWDMAVRTDHDILVRMAMIPRVMEARGLDVTPSMITKLEESGDQEAAAILSTIYTEEIRHVAKGSRWYRWNCEQRGIDPDLHFPKLVETYMKGRIKGPFNMAGRKAAGFSDQELSSL